VVGVVMMTGGGEWRRGGLDREMLLGSLLTPPAKVCL
jgi:hypothetical protein